MLDRLKIKCPGSWMVLCEDKLDDGAPYSSESLAGRGKTRDCVDREASLC